MIDKSGRYYDNNNVIIQAKHKELIISVLVFPEDAIKIVEKKYCYELIIEDNRIELNINKTDELIIQIFEYNASNVNFIGLQRQGEILGNFEIDVYLIQKFSYEAIHVVDAIEEVYKRAYENLYQELPPLTFFSSVLYKTMIKKLTEDFYETSYYNEMDYLNNSPMDRYLKLIGEWIQLSRLYRFQDLNVDMAMLVFNQR